MPKKRKVNKQLGRDKQLSAAAQKAWSERLKVRTGESGYDIFGDFDDEKFREAVGDDWYQVFNYHKDNGVKVKNVVAVMAKSTQKTKVAKKWQLHKMCQHKWLNAIDTRSTLDLKGDMMKHWRDVSRFLMLEQKLTWVPEKMMEASDSNYLVRESGRKDNQQMQFLSFNKLLQMGGYTTNTGNGVVFHHDELSDPSDALKGREMDEDEFVATYKLIDEKNEEMMISTGNRLDPNEPRHFFTQNRYNSNDPLTKFCEAHFPWHDAFNEETGVITPGVKTWMLKDPENNNFIVHYVEKALPGFDSIFDHTLIVYGNKFSNKHLTKDEEWVQRQRDLIEKGRPEDLAIIIGDLFEGYHGLKSAYHYSRKEKITLEEFYKDYAPHVTDVRIAIDLDFSRQIVISPKYSCAKPLPNGTKIYRCVRDRFYRVACHGVSDDGFTTEQYFKQTKAQLDSICKEIREKMPHIKKINLIFDDKKAQWVGRYNYGDASSPFWNAQKVNFDQTWRIKERPAVIDEMQDSGYIIDINHPTNSNLHLILARMTLGENSKKDQRIEKSNDDGVDFMNADEYGLYSDRVKLAFNHRATKKLGGENNW